MLHVPGSSSVAKATRQLNDFSQHKLSRTLPLSIVVEPLGIAQVLTWGDECSGSSQGNLSETTLGIAEIEHLSVDRLGRYWQCFHIDSCRSGGC